MTVGFGAATASTAAETPKVLTLDPTLMVADYLDTAAIDANDAGEEPAYDDRLELSWGVALTSNYISSGVTQSDDEPAFQAWGEIASGIVYAGIWLSTVDLDGDNWEFDLSWGIRPEFGPLSLDIGYIRYVYDDTGTCCGEWIAAADYALNDKAMLNGEFAWDPQYETRSASAGLTLALAEQLEFSGAIERDLETHDHNWEAGIAWSFNDNLSLDLRYHDAEFAGPRFVVTLAWQGSTSH